MDELFVIWLPIVHPSNDVSVFPISNGKSAERLDRTVHT